MAITTGDRIYVMDIRRQEHRRRALTGPIPGYDFEVVWTCREDEWDAAQREDREPDGMPWPSEDVRPAS